MRILLTLTLLFCLTTCDTVESVEALSEYDIPIEPGVKSMVYTYTRRPGHDTIRHQFEFVSEEGAQLVTQNIYVNAIRTFERRYRISDGKKELLEEIFYDLPGETVDRVKGVKGDIINYNEIDDNTKYKGLEIEVQYANSLGLRYNLKGEEKYEKDTTVQWEGVARMALVFRYVGSSNISVKYLPFLDKKNSWTGVSYYAQGIGLMMYSQVEGDSVYKTKLVAVKKMLAPVE